MKTFETLLKRGLLYVFSLLNAIDMVQTMSFLKLGIESNQFAVYYPNLWFILKIVFTFGLPVGLFKLDTYLQAKKNGDTHDFLKSLVSLLYLTIIFADIYFLVIVSRNISILGRIV
jgi:hypothetical protein